MQDFLWEIWTEQLQRQLDIPVSSSGEKAGAGEVDLTPASLSCRNLLELLHWPCNQGQMPSPGLKRPQ